MDIGVIGWWSYDNQGDRAMLTALKKGLSPHHVIPLDVGFTAQTDTLYRLNRLDYVILGGGTLIAEKPARPFDDFDRWHNQLHCPLGVVGLGVDPILEPYRAAANALVDQASFFFVRDRASHRLLNRSAVQVAPDLTFSDPLRLSDYTHRRAQKPVCGVNVRQTFSFNPRPWLDIIAQLPMEIRGIPLSSFGSFNENALLRHLDPNCSDAYDPRLYEGLDLLIGTAFHSLVFAVQAGIPVIAISYAPKVRNYMEDIGLAQYALAATEWDRLPEVVDKVLAEHHQLRQQLLAIRTALHRDAKQMLQEICTKIEQTGLGRERSGPLVTVIVMGSGDSEADGLTLTSCLAQTYENTEFFFYPQAEAPDIPGAALNERVTVMEPASLSPYGDRLQRAIDRSKGTYLTWLDSGDWLTEDALDCLVNRIEQDHDCDLIYADYWQTDEENMPLSILRAPEARKLYRRNVVGPCFLVKKQILEGLDHFPADSPLPAYSLWLQIGTHNGAKPFHAPLMYSRRRAHQREVIEVERTVRRRQRKSQPIWSRAIGNFIDSDFCEQYLVQPIARLSQSLGRVMRAVHE